MPQANEVKPGPYPVVDPPGVSVWWGWWRRAWWRAWCREMSEGSREIVEWWRDWRFGFDFEEFYEGVRGLACLVVFVGLWAYAVAQYGLLLGVGLGWLPAMILSALVAILWPVVFVLLGLAVVAVGLLLLWVVAFGG